jgi:hypothetical protein
MWREELFWHVSILHTVHILNLVILTLSWFSKRFPHQDESCTIVSFIICTHHQMLLDKSNQRGWGGWGMWHAWVRGETCTGLWWESPKERDHFEDQGVDGRMGSKWSLGRLIGGVEWIHLAQDRDRWRAVVNAVVNLRVLAPRSYLVSCPPRLCMYCLSSHIPP